MLSMTDIHQTYALNKNISLVPIITGSQVNYGSSMTAITYDAKFTVSAASFLQ